MKWWELTIIIIVVWLCFAGGFFYMTAEDNWDAGTAQNYPAE